MSQVTGTTSIQQPSISSIAERSPQVALAMLMMDMAELNKTNAQGKIADIEKQQAQKRECSDALNAARSLKDSGVRGSASQKDYEHMAAVGKDYQSRGWAATPDMDKWWKDHGITPGQWGSVSVAKKQWGEAIEKLETLKKVNGFCDTANIKMPDSADKETNKKQWDTVIANLQTKLDTIGGNTQTQMVQLQDLMGQYNSEIQGANSAIAQANQVMTAVSKGG